MDYAPWASLMKIHKKDLEAPVIYQVLLFLYLFKEMLIHTLINGIVSEVRFSPSVIRQISREMSEMGCAVKKLVLDHLKGTFQPFLQLYDISKYLLNTTIRATKFQGFETPAIH